MMPRVNILKFASLLLIVGCSPNSLVEAIKAQEGKGIFGKPLYVITPITGQHDSDNQLRVLGHRPSEPLTPDTERQRILHSEPSRCFFVSPSVAPTIQRLEVKYTSNSNLRAEVEATVVAVGTEIGSESTATLTLSNLKVIQGLGVLDLNGPCALEESGTMRVFTQLVVAGDASLAFSGTLKVKADATIPVNAGLKIRPSVGHGAGRGTTIDGKDLVLGGALSDVKVIVTKRLENLGPSPIQDRAYDFPTGMEGAVTIRGFDAGENKLTILVAPQTESTLSNPPKGFIACEVGKLYALEPGKSCGVWFPAGNALLSIRWNIDENKNVILIMKGYKTTFSGPR